MERLIVGFHQDPAGGWVAELDCGHHRHVRHDPPWQVRPWIEDEAGRNGRIGALIECGRCAENERQAYLDARMQGLCEDGAEEASRPRAPEGRDGDR